MLSELGYYFLERAERREDDVRELVAKHNALVESFRDSLRRGPRLEATAFERNRLRCAERIKIARYEANELRRLALEACAPTTVAN